MNISIPREVNQKKQIHYEQQTYKERDGKYKMVNDPITEPLKKVCAEYVDKVDTMLPHIFLSMAAPSVPTVDLKH